MEEPEGGAPQGEYVFVERVRVTISQLFRDEVRVEQVRLSSGVSNSSTTASSRRMTHIRIQGDRTFYEMLPGVEYPNKITRLSLVAGDQAATVYSHALPRKRGARQESFDISCRFRRGADDDVVFTFDDLNARNVGDVLFEMKIERIRRPAPPKMTYTPDKMIILGSTSRCHHAESIIVRSREGGFVTQNCTSCGHPRALQPSERPDLVCGHCDDLMQQRVGENGNYEYLCLTCGVVFELATLVPHWNELFEYFGYEIDSDFDRSKRRLTDSQIGTLLRDVRLRRAPPA